MSRESIDLARNRNQKQNVRSSSPPTGNIFLIKHFNIVSLFRPGRVGLGFQTLTRNAPLLVLLRPRDCCPLVFVVVQFSITS